MSGSLQQMRMAAEERVRRGVAWWTGELHAMLPWQGRTDPARAPVVLDYGGSTATLVLAGRGGGEPRRVEIDAGRPGESRAAVQAALRAAGQGRDVVLRLAPALLLEADISLPPAAGRAMRPILTNQLERLVPLPAADVDFEYRVAPGRGAERSLDVHLTIVRKATVAEALGLARALGLDPQAIIAPGGGAPGSAAGEDGPVVLWKAGREETAAPGRRRLYRGLEVAGLVLLVLAYAVFVFRLDEQVDRMEQDVRDKTRLAGAAREFSRAQQEANAALDMVAARAREPSPLFVWSEVTQLVPTNSWISRMTVRGRTVEILGDTPNVAELIARIDNHDVFWDPEFLSPVTRSRDGRTQRFNLSFQIWLEGDEE